jgi:hypothetical protein
VTYHDARQCDLFAAPPSAAEPFSMPDSEIVPTGSTFDTEPPPDTAPSAVAAADDDNPHGIAACQRRWVGNKEVVEVDPKRLDRDHGDIADSYCADTIATEGRTRKPFRFQGGEWVNTGSYGQHFECYRIVAVEQFDGPTAPYAKWDWAAMRGHEMGGYHGMSAKQGGREIVLVGPPIIAVPGKPEQAALL